MKFYINQVTTEDSDWEHQCIGLFTNNEWKGVGNFCGYYAAEYYLNTILIAYGVQIRNGNYIYDPLYPFKYCKKISKNYNEILIGSNLWEETFEAINVIDALNIFYKQQWRHKDEI